MDASDSIEYSYMLGSSERGITSRDHEKHSDSAQQNRNSHTYAA